VNYQCNTFGRRHWQSLNVKPKNIALNAGAIAAELRALKNVFLSCFQKMMQQTMLMKAL
jgi:hypothetical protein